jgi:hypothetical protein
MEAGAAAGLSSKGAQPCFTRRTGKKAQPASATHHVEVLRAGPRAWNAWRLEHPGVIPVLNDLDVSVTERQFGRVQGGPINLSRAQLCRARLDQATLIEANLMGAVLTGADLADARLERADLRGARFDHANLAGAQLNGANLRGAHLRLARGLTQAQIDRSLGDHRTALPCHLTAPGAWLDEGPPDRQRSVRQTGQSDVDADKTGDPAFLRAGPRSSLRETRAACRKSIRDSAPASKRRHTIDRAYQEPKKLDRRAGGGHKVSGPLPTSNIVFAAVLVAAIAVGALIAMMQSRREHAGTPPGEATPVLGTSAQDGGSQTVPPGAGQRSSG